MSKIIDVRNNLLDFQNGALKAIKLFKVVFDVNKNIIISKNEKLHINNTELMLEKQNGNNKEFLFGFNYVLENIEEYRKQLCINPIFYLLILEYIIKNLDKIKEIENIVCKIEKFVADYYKNSNLCKARPTFDELCFIQEDNIKNDFLKEVAKVSYDLTHITIKEDKFNLIEKNPYYTIKANHYGYNKEYKNYEVIIWFSKITLKELKEFENFVLLNRKKVVVFYNDSDKETIEHIKNYISYDDSIAFVHISGLSFYDKMRDIQIICGCQSNYFDSSFQKIYDYQFGKLDYLKFDFSEIKMLGSKKYEDVKQQLSYLNNYNKLERLLTLQHKCYIIHINGEYLENTRCIVSSCRSMYNNGVFYNEIGTISLMLYFFREKKVINFLEDILLNFLLLHLGEDAYNFCEVIKKHNDFKKFFNLKTKSFEKNNMFIPYEVYVCAFNLLKSNIKMIKNFI